MKASPVATAVAFALAACSVSSVRRPEVVRPAVTTAAPEESPPVAASAVDYTYQLLTPQLTGLTQVFDNGRWTYVSFAAAVPVGLMIFDQEGRAVPFHAVEKTVVLDTVRRGWLIRTPTVSSYAQIREGARVAEAGDSALPVDLAAARAEILSDMGRLAVVSAELHRAERGAPSASVGDLKAEVEQMQTELNGVNATLVRAVFPSGSVVLTISEETHQELLEAAQQARWVTIRGGADSTGSAQANARIALARAETLQRLLIEGGVAAEKVSVSAASHDYVASNDTAEGRALNRRADVYFIGHSDTVVPLTLPIKPELKSETLIQAPDGRGALAVRRISEARITEQ